MFWNPFRSPDGIQIPLPKNKRHWIPPKKNFPSCPFAMPPKKTATDVPRIEAISSVAPGDLSDRSKHSCFHLAPFVLTLTRARLQNRQRPRNQQRSSDTDPSST